MWMMLVMIMAPELVVSLALRQFMCAIWISKEFHISKTHGFFCTMGGFVTPDGHPIAKAQQLPMYISAIRLVEEADIRDRSKGDALSKGVAIMQALWFMTQCFARLSQHLPITELEVATLAFAIVSIFIRLLWLWKPLDVQRSIIVAASSSIVSDPPAAADTNLRSRMISALMSALTPQGGADKITWQVLGDYSNYNPSTSTSVPSFYSMDIKDSKLFGLVRVATIISVGAIFGSIHCAAWNALFPSTAEMWMWRVTSLFIMVYPFQLAVMVGGRTLVSIIRHTLHRLGQRSVAIFVAEPFIMTGLMPIMNFSISAGLPIYLFCRLILVVLSFTTLRALSPADFVDADWSKYIPHL
ncbi:hypothetical protein B0H16DRAFT_1839922 [Mycena metata]|uniref:Pheromone receptor n=1 Tax=Mycena metata TaxID=1033252 RepID=A0AAD7IW00_9AGAR|nr:hypothetical protein B0H16DRAFT_1839922 [Mycena metata]